VAEEMAVILDRLEQESLEVTRRQESGRVTLGFDYVVVAEKRAEKEDEAGVKMENDDKNHEKK
jgi:hypothetical protein